MRGRTKWVALALFVGACGGEETTPAEDVPTRDPLELEAVSLVDAVDPFIGTGGIGFATGSTYPGPAVPFGMIHLGPDTSVDGSALPAYHCSGYRYEDSHIDGFSLLRMNGTGIPDYGTVAVMPVDGMTEARRSEDGYRSAYDHADEAAEPGYYRVRLATGMEVEITTAARSGVFRFTFPEGVDPTLVVDLEHTIGGGESDGGRATWLADGSLDGWMHNLGVFSRRFEGFGVYSRWTFDVEPVERGVWSEEAGLSTELGEATGVDVGAWVRFPAGTRTVEAKVGVSFVDGEGAGQNLASEIGDAGFDTVRERAREAWAGPLSTVEIFEAGPPTAETLDRATEVATAIYHAYLMPTLVSDVDGRVRDVNDQITTTDHPRYSDFSLWDTYRTLHPWMMLVEDPVNVDFLASLVDFGREGGAVPRWSLAHSDVRSMIGSPGEIVLAESAAKGIAFEDEAEAFDFARATAFGPAPGAIGGRSAVEDYVTLGYVADDRHGGSVSRTQEYAIADGALAAWAERLGRGDDAEALGKQAQSYRTTYDPSVGFFRGLKADGSLADWPGELAEGPQYTEGNAWQYLWLAPHDPEGLAETLGGRPVALERLRELFGYSVDEVPILGHRKYYWHGNEPAIHAPWLFAMWGSRAETGRWVRWTADTFYGQGPGGLPGNDDGGTMSAWLLFATAGIYPIAGFDRYVVGVPLLPRVVIHRPSGDLVVETDADPATHPRVMGVTLDGEPLTGPYVTHGQLAGEHRLVVSVAR